MGSVDARESNGKEMLTTTITMLSWVLLPNGNLSFQTLVPGVCFDHLFGEDGDNTLHFTILNCDCCRRLFGSKVTHFKKAFLMKFLRGVMDVYRRDDDDDDDDEDGIRVTSITRMVFPSGPLQLTDHHLLYLAERSPELRELSLPFGRNIKHEGLSRAIRYWNRMEEMSIGPVICNNDIFRIIEAIGINCKKLEALELLGLVLTQQLSPEIAKSLKGLKLLRLEMICEVIDRAYEESNMFQSKNCYVRVILFGINLWLHCYAIGADSIDTDREKVYSEGLHNLGDVNERKMMSIPSREETLDGLVLSQSVASKDVSSTPREKEIKDELKEIWMQEKVAKQKKRIVNAGKLTCELGHKVKLVFQFWRTHTQDTFLVLLECHKAVRGWWLLLKACWIDL
ncbi:unnamed protein product [Camellia sinensis]